MGKQSKTRKRSQKGGAWYNPLSWGKSSDPYAPKKSWGQWFSGTSSNVIQGADNAVGSAANAISTGAQNTYSNLFSSQPVAPVAPVAPVVQPVPLNNQNISNDSLSTNSLSTDSQPTVAVSDYSDSTNSRMGGKKIKGNKKIKSRNIKETRNKRIKSRNIKETRNKRIKSRNIKETRKMKGGYKGEENLAYYASPVQGLKVAAPTYWISSNTNAPLSGGLTRRRLHR